MPRLDFYINYELQATVKLDAEEVLVGRDPSCALCMPDKRVSRVHAVIRSDGDGHEIENRGTNGTKVNGNKLEQAQRLEAGDAIFISKYILIYQSDDDAPPEAESGTLFVS